jgi:hypothetical protein
VRIASLNSRYSRAAREEVAEISSELLLNDPQIRIMDLDLAPQILIFKLQIIGAFYIRYPTVGR